jgi:hypothetical protein
MNGGGYRGEPTHQHQHAYMALLVAVAVVRRFPFVPLLIVFWLLH